MTLTIGSLFSGIGGLELGLELGLGNAETRWQVEYEEHARLILAQHWPDAERHQDVRHVGAANLIPVDLICGGYPCQPHSTAGHRRASHDERDLWGEFARVVGELEPRWVVAENVRGVLSSADPAYGRSYPGGFFARVLGDLARLGYDAEWECFQAASIGAPHLRDRVFLVAYARDPRRWQPDPRDDLAHAERGGWPGGRKGGNGAEVEQSGHQLARGGAVVRRLPTWAGGEWEQPWPLVGPPEPGAVGVADGAAVRVDRLTRLGNGVVPQQAAVIGRAIRDAEAHWRAFGVMPERIIRPEHWRAA